VIIISYEGSPKEVGGDFNCYNNKLVTLKGCPAKIGGAHFKNSDIYKNSSQKKLVILISSPVYTLWDYLKIKIK
jgi:hypothetical protein